MAVVYDFLMDIYLVHSTYQDYFGEESTDVLGVFSSKEAAETGIATTQYQMARDFPSIAGSYSYEIEGPLTLDKVR